MQENKAKIMIELPDGLKKKCAGKALAVIVIDEESTDCFLWQNASINDSVKLIDNLDHIRQSIIKEVSEQLDSLEERLFVKMMKDDVTDSSAINKQRRNL